MIAPRVLLVDDDELVDRAHARPDQRRGLQVSAVTSGAAALADLQREFAPIVILDRNMPGMDGLELCRAIRGGTEFPGYVYIILCTAHDSEDEILAGLEAGADDYLSKRASGTQLIARLGSARRILSLEHSLKLAIEERRRMALTDALTGAHNRRSFMKHVRREIKRAAASAAIWRCWCSTSITSSTSTTAWATRPATPCWWSSSSRVRSRIAARVRLVRAHRR